MTILKDVDLPGIAIVPCRLNGPRGIVKSWVLTGDQTVVVDTGFSAADAELIAAALERAGKRVPQIDLCILTHEHGDHIGGMSALYARGPFPVAAHPLDAATIAQKTGVPVDRLLEDGEVLPLCGGLRVVHLPGHTPGSLAIYHSARRTLLAGDTVFSAGEWLLPPPPYLCADPAQAVQSVHRLIGLGLDVENVLVAHGDDVYGDGAAGLRMAVRTQRTF